MHFIPDVTNVEGAIFIWKLKALYLPALRKEKQIHSGIYAFMQL